MKLSAQSFESTLIVMDFDISKNDLVASCLVGKGCQRNCKSANQVPEEMVCLDSFKGINEKRYYTTLLPMNCSLSIDRVRLFILQYPSKLHLKLKNEVE